MSMITTKRTIRRNSTIILLATLLLLGFTIRYRTEVRNIFLKLRSKKEIVLERNDIESDVTWIKTESKLDDREVLKFRKDKTNKNKNSEINLEYKIIPPILPKTQEILSKTKTSEKCSLNEGEKIFIEENDGYETLHADKTEIYSEKYLHSPMTVKPVFSNPVIRLHPDKFFLPIVMRGPNNQLIGFRESIYVAVRLNRTLVIPRFKKHRTDSEEEGVDEFIHPRHRVDFETLCRFISCITMQQFRQACGNQADVIFRLRHYSKRRIEAMESSTGMRFSTRENREKFKCIPPDPKNKKILYFGPSEKEIRKLFESEARCAIYAQPFYNMKFRLKSSRKHITSQKDLKSMTNTEVISEILQRTPAPKYIQNIATEFIQTKFRKEKFLTVHWRYDKKDWMRRCPKLDKSAGRKALCNEAAKSQPQDVARAINLKLETLQPNHITHVYIASPPSEKSFINEVKKILNDLKIVVYHLEDLEEFLSKNYKSCEFLTTHKNDIESTIEMEICTKGYVFLRSTHSSWSSNVIDWRRHNALQNILTDKDEDILLLTKKSMEKNP